MAPLVCTDFTAFGMYSRPRLGFSHETFLIRATFQSLRLLSEFSKPPGALYRQQQAVQHPGDFQPQGKTANIFYCTLVQVTRAIRWPKNT